MKEKLIKSLEKEIGHLRETIQMNMTSINSNLFNIKELTRKPLFLSNALTAGNLLDENNRLLNTNSELIDKLVRLQQKVNSFSRKEAGILPEDENLIIDEYCELLKNKLVSCSLKMPVCNDLKFLNLLLERLIQYNDFESVSHVLSNIRMN